MTDQLRIPADTLAAVRSRLDVGRAALEDTATSAPGAIDAGDMTAMLTSMMSRTLDDAASLSEGLGGISRQVATAGTDFWQVDDAGRESLAARGGLGGY